jgi:hypothetical protein
LASSLSLTENSETLQTPALVIDHLWAEYTPVDRRILVVENEAKVAQALKEGLESEH